MGFPEEDPLAQAYVTAFVQALKRFGWVEDQNIRIDYRFSAVDPTLLKTYAAELVGLSPDAILTGGLPAVGVRYVRTLIGKQTSEPLPFQGARKSSSLRRIKRFVTPLFRPRDFRSRLSSRK